MFHAHVLFETALICISLLVNLKPSQIGSLMFLPARPWHCNENCIPLFQLRMLGMTEHSCNFRQSLLTFTCFKAFGVSFFFPTGVAGTKQLSGPINYLAPIAFRKLLRNYDDKCKHKTGNAEVWKYISITALILLQMELGGKRNVWNGGRGI